MTIRYVSPTGSSTAPYDTWAKASTSLTTVTALMGAGDITYVDNTLNQTFGATTNILIAGTQANPAQLISTNDIVNMPPTTIAAGAKVSGGAGAFSVSLGGNFYAYGLEIDGGTGSAAKVILAINSGLYNMILESCTLKVLATSATAGILVIGTTGLQDFIRTINCTFVLGNSASQTIISGANWEDFGGTYLHTTTQPTNLFGDSGNVGVQKHFGCDFSDITTTICGPRTIYRQMYLEQCKLASGVAVLATQTSLYGGGEVWLSDCAFGNVQYTFAHYNYMGNTVAQTAIYENEQGTGDGAYYDLAKDPICWTITGVNSTYSDPYYSPWISAYNELTSALTPSLEIARDGSTTAYNNDQVWVEFIAKITAAVTLGTIDYSNKRGLVAAAAAQANSAKTITNWTGLSATYWLGKLAPAATITPAVAGDIKARVAVCGAITVYVNPRILGL
jgi:hypothetical protein